MSPQTSNVMFRSMQYVSNKIHINQPKAKNNDIIFLNQPEVK